MADLFRTQSQLDFQSRISRVDNASCRRLDTGSVTDTTARRPFGSILAGFAWAYVVIAVASNRAVLESSLRQGSLPAEYHDYIFMGLAALVAVSLVMLCLHVLRLVARRGARRTNSRGMLIGVMGALTLVYTPSGVWDTGLAMMDRKSRNLLLSASSSVSEALPGVDFGTISFASSQGK